MEFCGVGVKEGTGGGVGENAAVTSGVGESTSGASRGVSETDSVATAGRGVSVGGAEAIETRSVHAVKKRERERKLNKKFFMRRNAQT